MSPPLVTVAGLPSKSDTARQQEASKLSPLIAVAGMLDCFNISFTAVQIRSQIFFVDCNLLEDAEIMLVTPGDSVLGGGCFDLAVLCDERYMSRSSANINSDKVVRIATHCGKCQGLWMGHG